MTSPYIDWKKDGLKAVMTAARVVCRLITTYGGIIKSKYAVYAEIVLLVNLAEALCAQLPAAQEDLDAFSFEDAPIPSDPSTLAGINPAADDAPELELP